MNDLIKQIAEIFAATKNVVAVTGAGISTEAGIPDFRGKDGIYTRLGEGYATEMLSISTFYNRPQDFYAFYRQYFRLPKVAPAQAHLELTKMQKSGYLSGIVTQNVDGLHQKAGTQNIIAIHGNRNRYICMNERCQTVHDDDYVYDYGQIVPRCQKCREILKPDVVLFGEAIKEPVRAWEIIRYAGALLVIGTSLSVYPLAGLVAEFKDFNPNLIIINKEPTQMDDLAKIKVEAEHTGRFLAELNKLLPA